MPLELRVHLAMILVSLNCRDFSMKRPLTVSLVLLFVYFSEDFI